jgi:predicted N-acetyltransferase YhbS
MNLSSSCNPQRIAYQSANIRELSPELIEQLDTWMATQFTKYTWQPSTAEQDVDFVLAWKGSELVARSAVVTREVLVDDNPLVIMGLAGVVVKEGHQGDGIGREMLRMSMIQVNNSPLDFCILLCERELEPLYSKLGFRHIPGRNAIFSQPDGQQYEYKPDKGITMVYEKNGQRWPGGLLDLKGLPF